MKKAILLGVAIVALMFLFSGVSEALLIDRGGGMIYDTDQDITWLQDANYAYTSSAEKLPGGVMLFNDALNWVGNLVYGNYYDWRLPTTPGTQSGFVNEGEMGYLFYNYGISSSSPGPFINVQADIYWTGTEYSPAPDHAWFFFPGNGRQDFDTKEAANYAWAVRDGDVIPHVEYNLIGREYFPGIIFRDTTIGAMFAGKVVNDEGIVVGNFNVSTNHQDGPVEACKAFNTLVRFKLTMNFFDGRRMVLVMPYGETAKANWIWDDVNCPDGGRGCEIHSLDNLELDKCEDVGDPNVSLIAEVGTITLNKRKFGSRGFDEISGGILYGLLIHTPPIFPAVIGTFVGN